MFIVIGFMLAGITAGYLMRKTPLKGISQLLTVLIWLLLFLLGWEVGCNRPLMQSLPQLGGTALLISSAGTLGSALAAAILWKLVGRNKRKKNKA